MLGFLTMVISVTLLITFAIALPMLVIKVIAVMIIIEVIKRIRAYINGHNKQ